MDYLTEVDAVTDPLAEWELASDPLDRITEEEVQRALLTLPEEYRLAVLLCDVEEMSYEEIARVMECPVGTVRSRIARGRPLLRQALAAYATRHGYGKGADHGEEGTGSDQRGSRPVGGRQSLW